MDIKQLLDRPIAYHRAFVPFAGVAGAILLSQALYWHNRTPNKDGWFWKTREEWKEETGLGRKAQEATRDKLKELGIIEEKLQGIPARLFFRVNIEVLTNMLQGYQQGGAQGYQQVGPKGTNKVVPENQPQNEAKNQEPTNTETTTETTKKEINKEKEKVIIPSLQKLSSFIQNAKNSVAPLTSLEQWEMAKELDVPLWIVKETEKSFWEYVEDPKKLKKYTTSYKTIKKWISMRLSKGEVQHCNEVEKMQLESDHPDLVAKRKLVFRLAEEEGIVE